MIYLPTPENLRRLRKAAGLTQAELAKRAGVSQSLIARIEAGTVNPRLSTLRKILSALEEYVKEEFKARDVMNSPVITVGDGEGIDRIVDLMWSNAISQLPVVDEDGIVVGMVHERDVVRAFLKHRERALALRARDIMSEPPPIVPPGAPLSTVTLLVSDRYPAVLVMDGRKIVGIITRSDIMRFMLSAFRSHERRPSGRGT